MIRSMVDKERPDFIAITGDIVSGQAWDRLSGHFWEHNYTMLAELLGELQVPYGLVPGFHDFEADLNSKQMLEVEGKFKYAASVPNFFDYYGHQVLH